MYFDIFEQILLENDYIKFCGVYDDITLFSKRKLINDFGQPVKIIFIDLNTINDLKYDEKSGWDDSDFILQCICNDIIPYSISLSYKCDKTTANSQTTFEESNVDRYNRFTNMFIKKWTEDCYIFGRKMKARGINGIKINTRKLRNLYNKGYRSKDFLKFKKY